MKRLIIAGLLLSLTPAAGAHGGNYSGPGGGLGDTVPPSPSPSSSTSDPTPSPSAGEVPVAGDASSGSGVTAAPPTAAAAAPMSLEDDVTSWRFWWYYNSKPYLNLKQALKEQAVTRGSDDYFLGVGRNGAAVGGVAPDARLVQGQILPQLIEHLRSETSQQVLTSALLSLSRLEGDAAQQARVEAEISRLLAHSDRIVVEVAAISLGILGSERSAVKLAALLEGGAEGRKLRGGPDVGDRIRAFAAYGLGQIGHVTERSDVKRYAASKLRAAFDAAGPSEYDVRVACLLSLGAVPLDSNPDYRSPGSGALLASSCLQAQVEWAIGVLGDEQQHQFVRAHAPTTLARLLEDAERRGLDEAKALAAEVLLGVLKSGSNAPAQITQSTALALGQLGDSDDDELDREIRAALEKASEKASDQATRNFALISLAQVSGRPGTDGAVTGAASTRETLIARIKHGATMQRPWAALAIGVMERSLADVGQPVSGEAAAFLRATLSRTRSPELTSATAIALGILEDAGSEELLLEILDRSSDTNIRGYTMISLGLIRARGSLSEIESILVKSRYRPELVQTAAVSLALMHDTELVPKLIEMLHSNSSLPAQGAICFSLGNVGDVRAAEALIEMATSPDLGAVARGLAIEALGLVADRYELPWNTELSANTNYLANPTSLSSPDIVGVLDLF